MTLFYLPIQSLEDVEKDVAGVKNRSYRNSAYKMYRPGAPPLHLVVECATPLHTLYKARSRRALSDGETGWGPNVKTLRSY